MKFTIPSWRWSLRAERLIEQALGEVQDSIDAIPPCPLLSPRCASNAASCRKTSWTATPSLMRTRRQGRRAPARPA